MPEGFVGTFTVNISAEQLKRGLRPSKRSPRNTGYLVECLGAVGQDGVMQALALLSRLDTSVITDTFPFPQIFVCVHFIIVCSATKIYEFDGSSLIFNVSFMVDKTEHYQVYFRQNQNDPPPQPH